MSFLLRHWKLAIVAVLLLALGAVWWMYRAEIERRVDMALRAGEVTQALEQAEADKAALVEARRRNDRLRRQVEQIRAKYRQRVEAAEAELSRVLDQDQAADSWAREPTPVVIREWLLHDARGDGPAREDSAASDSDSAVPGARAPGGDQRRPGPDGAAPARGADELQ